jgi:hypothetical protein
VFETAYQQISSVHGAPSGVGDVLLPKSFFVMVPPEEAHTPAEEIGSGMQDSRSSAS